MATKVTALSADAALAAVAALLNNGRLVLYAGVEPATGAAALGAGNVALAQLSFANPAFGAPVADDQVATSRRVVANAIAPDGAADASGQATFFRAYRAAGTAPADVVCQGGAGTAAANLEMVLSSAAIVAGGGVSVTSLKIVLPTV